MKYLLDVAAMAVVALVVLFPEPSIRAFPAAVGDAETLSQMAKLQDAVRLAPGDAKLAGELARAYLAVEQPGWALATLAPHLDRHLPEIHQVAAYSYATLLRPKEALAQAEAGLSACEAAGCEETRRIRLSYLRDMMRKPAEQGVDPKKDPLTAKQLVGEALRATRVPEAPTK